MALSHVCLFVCLSVCPRSKRKTAGAMSIKVGRHIVMTGPRHALTLTSKGQRSNPNPKPRVRMRSNVSLHIDKSISLVYLLVLTCIIIQLKLQQITKQPLQAGMCFQTSFWCPSFALETLVFSV